MRYFSTTTNKPGWMVGFTLLMSGLLYMGMAFTSSATELRTEKAMFSMYWYWTGEATLGRLPGIIQSKIGHLNGSEIVEVEYDPTQTDVETMTAALKQQSSFYSRIDATETAQHPPHFIEPKHSLRNRHPELLELDLTEQQKIALNSWSYFGGPMPDVLTAEQKIRLTQIEQQTEQQSFYQKLLRAFE